MPYKDPKEQRRFQRERTAMRRAEAIAERGGKCLRCSSTKSLEFHHRKRSTKKDHKVWSWKESRRKAELKKCDLLCRECHAKETAKERGYGTSPHGTLTCYQNYRCRCKLCRAANADQEHRRRLRNMSV
jgi:hypothetical protein